MLSVVILEQVNGVLIKRYLSVEIHPTGRCIVLSIPSPTYLSLPRRQHTWQGQMGLHHICKIEEYKYE